MEKYIKDGKVAVLVSPDCGAGWSTWARGDRQKMMFCPEMVECILHRNSDGLEKLAAKLFPDEYQGGVQELEVRWVPVGSRFLIEEYDGSESLVIEGQYPDWYEWATA